MSQAPPPPASPDDLQFNTAEPGDARGHASGGQSCIICHQPIASTYYALGDQVLCPRCAEQVNEVPMGGGIGRLFKAMVLGTLAALLAAAIWYAIRRVTNMEIGLVAILVGLMVGGAVRKGSGGRGGFGYQVLAVLLTYAGITANYMPDIIQQVIANEQNEEAQADGQQVEAEDNAAAPNAAGENNAPADQDPDEATGIAGTIAAWTVFLLIIFVISLAAPFMAGAQNIIGLLIIGFALWEAWKINSYRELPLSGPYQMAPRPAV